MSEFVGDGEGGAETVVLDDGATLFGVADGSDFGQTKSTATRHVVVAAKIFPVFKDAKYI